MGSSHSHDAKVEDETSGSPDEVINNAARDSASTSNSREDSPTQQDSGLQPPVSQLAVPSAARFFASARATTTANETEPDTEEVEGTLSSRVDNRFDQAASASDEVRALQLAEERSTSFDSVAANQDPAKEGQEDIETMDGTSPDTGYQGGPTSPETSGNKRKRDASLRLSGLPRGYNYSGHDHGANNDDAEGAGFILGLPKKCDDGKNKHGKKKMMMVESDDDGEKSDIFRSDSEKENEEGNAGASTADKDVEMIEATDDVAAPTGTRSKGSPRVVIPTSSRSSHPVNATTYIKSTATTGKDPPTSPILIKDSPDSQSSPPTDTTKCACGSTTGLMLKFGGSNTNGEVATRQGKENQTPHVYFVCNDCATDPPKNAATNKTTNKGKKKARRKISKKRLARLGRLRGELYSDGAAPSASGSHQQAKHQRTEKSKHQLEHDRRSQAPPPLQVQVLAEQMEGPQGENKNTEGHKTKNQKKNEKKQRSKLMKRLGEFDAVQSKTNSEDVALPTGQFNPQSQHQETAEPLYHSKPDRSSTAPLPQVQVDGSQQNLSVSCPQCHVHIPLTLSEVEPVGEAVKSVGGIPAKKKPKKNPKRRKFSKARKKEKMTKSQGTAEGTGNGAKDGGGKQAKGEADVIMIDD